MGDDCSYTLLVTKEVPEGQVEARYHKTEKIINSYPVWKSEETNSAIWFNGNFSQFGIISLLKYNLINYNKLII